MQLIRDALPELNVPLPSLEDEARAVLHWLLDYAEPVVVDGWKSEADKCPNCGVVSESLASPYCGDVCRERAAFVRQFRAAVASGALLDPAKQFSFGQKLWWLLGGGLPFRESIIPESAKRQVVRRSGGLCEICGATMMKVENHGSGCNRPLHLKAVCLGCSRTKGFGDAGQLSELAVRDLLIELGQRVGASTPLRVCDDPDHWNWRAYLALRPAESDKA